MTRSSIDRFRPTCNRSQLALSKRSFEEHDLACQRGRQMRRREFITLVGGAATVWPFRASAQQAVKVARIGILSPFSAADAKLWHQAFLSGLRDLGWVDGKNIVIEYRFADGQNDRLPALISELIQDKVDLIVTAVTNDTLVAKTATKNIPIVMAAAGDPIGAGLVASLSRPGGNITGLSQMNTDLAGKRLELLKELSPKIASVAVLLNPDDPISILGWNEIQPSARKLELRLILWKCGQPAILTKHLTRRPLHIGARLPSCPTRYSSRI